MVEGKIALIQVNIWRYRWLLDTHLNDVERQYVERRLSEEQAALQHWLRTRSSKQRSQTTSGYVACANIDHYLELLHNHDVPPKNRAVIMKLLIEEEDKLGHDQEQLECAEHRAARSRHRLHYLRNLRDAFADGTTDRVQADRLLANSEAIHQVMEQFCHHMREKVNSHGI